MCSVNCNGQWTLGSLYLGQHLVPCISVGHHYGQEVARRVHFKVLARERFLELLSGRQFDDHRVRGYDHAHPSVQRDDLMDDVLAALFS